MGTDMVMHKIPDRAALVFAPAPVGRTANKQLYDSPAPRLQGLTSTTSTI